MTAPRTASPDLLPRASRDLEAAPERLLLVIRHTSDRRYLLVRWPDWPHPAMLPTPPPHPDEGFAAGIASLVRARLGVTPVSEPALSAERVPARMLHPYAGGETQGWLRAVALDVEGDAVPDALLAGCDRLSLEEAERALSTDVERAVFRIGAALLGDRLGA
jgi:hypothetical protein